MKLAVTGGSGCLGQALIGKLLSNSHSINTLTVKGDKSLTIKNPLLHVIGGDLEDDCALADLLDRSEALFHLAAKVHDAHGRREDFARINYEGTKRIVDLALRCGVKKIVYYSTVAVYGKISHDDKFDEASPCAPEAGYGESKHNGEKYLLSLAERGMVDAVVFRLPMVYGAYDKGNVRRLIGAIAKKRFAYFGDGLAKRSMVCSGNVAEAACLAATKECGEGGEVFCVTDGEDHTIVDLVEAICEGLGTDWRPAHVPQWVADAAGRCGDMLKPVLGKRVPIDSDQVKKLSSSLTFSCEKIKRRLGYRPVVGLKEGIRLEIEWMKREGLL
jgi:nucleoside-diphosphate-sugar epimerase